ncbi:hypothetical protein [Micromonospora haikouensis]|uniref:hypothetical protein n=1 Tax=Micromonospora haikouensis TaxID=686309 RepID=UPI003D727B39
MTSTTPRGGLRKRVEPFVQVRSKTVNHGAMSFRALGVLTYLLDKPDGWDVRAEQMCKGKGREGREGREAVRTALRELAVAGYYRLERRQARSGKFAMGTAISETPVESWAEQARFFDGKAVPMVEQRDGTFLVKYPDGSLRPDDFPPPEKPVQEELFGDGEQRTGEESAGEAGDGILGPGHGDPAGDGFPGSGFPGADNPASGETTSGNTSPKTEEITKRGYTDSVPPSEVRHGDGEDPVLEEPAQLSLDGAIPRQVTPTAPAIEAKAERAPTNHDVAMGIARSWINYRASQNVPVVANNALHALKSLILPFLNHGYTEAEIKRALNGLEEGLPSKAQMERALVRVRGRITRQTPPGGRGRPAEGAIRVNDAWAADAVPAPAMATVGGEW